MEIIKGKIEVKKVKEVNHESMDDEVAKQMDDDAEVESVTEFQGGERATGKELKELGVGAKNRPGMIKCNACGAESGNEKYPPICKADCPKMFINDVLASSWHKGPNGKYHYCDTCVELVLEANGIETKAEGAGV